MVDIECVTAHGYEESGVPETGLVHLNTSESL